jgi:FkbM family methyltransferase
MTYVKLLRIVTKHYPFISPRAFLLNLLPEMPQNYGPFAGKSDIRYEGYFSDGDDISRNLFWLGDFEPWVCSTISRFAKLGTIGIDIGANIGATAMVMARAVGPSGRVICFEPIPKNIEYLRRNILANSLAWVQIEPVALSSRSSSLRMSMPEGGAGRSNICSDGPYKVDAVSFDEWIEKHPNLDISVCKIDAEWHELEIFTGMARTLTKQAIPVFIFERHTDQTNDPVFSMLQDYGYQIMRISKGLRNVYYDALNSVPRGRPTVDFLAVLTRPT